MKSLFLILLFIITASVYADFSSVVETKSTPPTAKELSTNRSCFARLEQLGCGDAGEDPDRFKTCMRDVYQDLNSSCKALMDDLYKPR